ncbi:MAG: DUF2141 domain-containing protein [Burkholderiales bacterium]|nr:DUF2141 domain-containing protein [Burkholderiales bacterium]
MFCSLVVASAGTLAAELEVVVAGERVAPGIVGCALYATEAGFPMDPTQARMVWVPWQTEGVLCRFTGLTEGRYAVSVMNDENANRKVDTNFLGMPQEVWGVSNNARPTLRPPRFNEAVFTLQGPVTRIEVRLAK